MPGKPDPNPARPGEGRTPSALSCACANARPLRFCLLPPSRTPSSSAQNCIRRFRCTGASPEGHAQENAAGVRPSPGVAGFGSGLPGIPARTTATLPARQKRHSEIGPPEEPPSRACCSASPSPPLRDPPTLKAPADAQVCRRRVRQKANTLLIRLRRTGGKIPRRACFDYRRRAGPFSLRRLGFTGVALRAPR